MHGKVKRLRERGVRLSDREIESACHVVGDVTLFGMGASYVLAVKDPNNQVGDSLFPELHHVRLVTMQGNKMLFRGEERPQGESGPAYVQEWAVLLKDR